VKGKVRMETYYLKQAENFMEYRHRGGRDFHSWARSKDLSPKDRAGILREIRGLGASGWRPVSLGDLIAQAKSFQEDGSVSGVFPLCQ